MIIKCWHGICIIIIIGSACFMLSLSYYTQSNTLCVTALSMSINMEMTQPLYCGTHLWKQWNSNVIRLIRPVAQTTMWSSTNQELMTSAADHTLKPPYASTATPYPSLHHWNSSQISSSVRQLPLLLHCHNFTSFITVIDWWFLISPNK